MVPILRDNLLNAALGNGDRKMHAFHGGEGRSSQHRPESIRRHPRKMSKSHQTGAIPIHAAFADFTPHECRNYLTAAGYDAYNPT